MACSKHMISILFSDLFAPKYLMEEPWEEFTFLCFCCVCLMTCCQSFKRKSRTFFPNWTFGQGYSHYWISPSHIKRAIEKLKLMAVAIFNHLFITHHPILDLPTCGWGHSHCSIETDSMKTRKLVGAYFL